MGGVICLELGSTKPDNFDEILTMLKDIVDNKNNYSLIIAQLDSGYDKPIIYSINPLITEQNGIYKIEISYVNKNFSGVRVVHTFNSKDSTYTYSRAERAIANYFDVTQLRDRVIALEQKLNKITQTE